MNPGQRPDEPIAIVVAEDSEIDRMLLNDVFAELNFHVQLTFVGDGEDLLTYLRACSTTGHKTPLGLPALVLMDMNMPRMKGIDALKALRADTLLRMLPVIALSTSDNPGQIAQAYAHGVNAYLAKPDAFDDYVALLTKFGAFWLQSAKLPVVHAAS